jgi:ABC-type antimicrobial peptide transport system permease subunit
VIVVAVSQWSSWPRSAITESIVIIDGASAASLAIVVVVDTRVCGIVRGALLGVSGGAIVELVKVILATVLPVHLVALLLNGLLHRALLDVI